MGSDRSLMVWVPLKNNSGQVLKDIKLKSPDNTSYTVIIYGSLYKSE